MRELASPAVEARTASLPDNGLFGKVCDIAALADWRRIRVSPHDVAVGRIAGSR